MLELMLCSLLTILPDYLYRRYVQNATGRRVDVEALQALDDCSRGKPATAIPVLEKRLRDAKITVPGGEFKP